MDRDQEELQSFGFFATLKESFKVIFSWKKIFSQITLSIVLPFAFIFLIQLQVTEYLYWKLHRDERALHLAANSSERGYYSYDHWSQMVTSDKISITLFRVTYYVVTLILSLLSTAAVVYTVASIYTSKPVAFKKVMGVVPRVWKRLVVTFLWSFGILFLWGLLAFALLYIWAVNLSFRNAAGVTIFVILLVSYLVGYIYIAIVLRIACVVSVLEEDYGIKALFKSKALIRGKTGISAGLFFLTTVFFMGTILTSQIFVPYVFFAPFGYMYLVWIPCLLFLAFVMLVELVIQTVIYFVCKSYHNESIDKPALADHLEVYNAQYEVMKSEKSVQMEQVMV